MSSGPFVTPDRIVAEVKQFLGDTYVYGATGPSTFDCSGLTQYVYRQLGINIPRTSQEQYAQLPTISSADALPGDLVFFAGSDGTTAAPGHVGIFIGNGQMIDAPHTGTVVRVDSIDGNVGFRRPRGVADAGIGAPGGSITGQGNTGGGGLNIPSDITGFFSSATTDLETVFKFWLAFFQPSTYIRIGAGILGTVSLVAGMVFLAREARSA